MPSSSAAQHRWIEFLNHDPEARKRSGMSAGKVSEWAHADKGAPWKHAGGGGITGYDAGGGTDPNAGDGIGGVTPAQGANPLMQGMIQKYQAYPTEKLAELAGMMGASPQGQLIQKLLMQRRTMPQQNPAPQQQQQQRPQQQAPSNLQMPGIAPLGTQPQQQPAPYKRGGTVAKRDAGGPMGISGSEASPWWTRSEARGADSGLLHGSTPGRADSIETTAPPGSHVIPADVIAGLGEGNTMSGARVMQGIIDSGPYGTPLPRGGRGHSIPRPPTESRSMSGELKTGGPVPLYHSTPRDSDNGKPVGKGGGVHETPVDLSDGEFVIHPRDVIRFGDGDKERGHRILDKWIVAQRKKHIKTLKDLPGPVGMKK